MLAKFGVDVDVKTRVDEEFRTEEVLHYFFDLAETACKENWVVREGFYESFLENGILNYIL